MRNMRLMSIASGSGGNAVYVGNDDTHILIDAGVSRKRISEGLKRAGLSAADLDAILVTHEHADHIKGLKVLEKTWQIPVFATNGTISGIKDSIVDTGFDHIFNVIERDASFMINDLNITALSVSHDAREPVCFRIDDGNASCGVITDLGCFDRKIIDGFQGLDAVLAESNHDIRMLESGPYPYPLKRRIAGNTGHLSNESSGRLISELLNDHMQYIILGHLSRKNNYDELALLTVENIINESRYRSEDFRIDVAGQDDGTDIYEF